MTLNIKLLLGVVALGAGGTVLTLASGQLRLLYRGQRLRWVAVKTRPAVPAVPPAAAQAVVDRAAKAGVQAMLNFAPASLHAPAGVTVRTVDMALELEILSYALVSAKAAQR